MPHAVTMPSPGLQALILCGPGSSFPTFTSDADENPKALLAIANRPMVWYPIELCYRTGITDIKIICPPSAEAAMAAALGTNPYLTSLPHPLPDLLAPKGLEYTMGTAEILRLAEVRSMIRSDFVVLPCDLVCELGADKLVQAWMVGASQSLAGASQSLADRRPRSGALGVWYDTKAGTRPIKGEETDFIATAPLSSQAAGMVKEKDWPLRNVSQLLLSVPTDSWRDLVESRKGFPIRHGLLRKQPRIRMLSSHRDAHIYIFPSWIVDFVARNEKMESLGEDVMGMLAKASWQSGLAEKLALDTVLARHSPALQAEEGAQSRGPAALVFPASTSSTTSESGASAPASGAVRYERGQRPPILAYVLPSEEDGPLMRRVDTAPLLLSVSLQLAKLASVEEAGPEASVFAHARKVAYPEGVKSRTTITRQDSLLGENVTVEEKTSIKECVVGANCQIGEGAKMLQCVLMDGVVVGRGCRLTRCIVGKRCEIGHGSTLTNCEVQENLLVESGTEDKDSKLMSSAGLEASEEEMAGDDVPDGPDGHDTALGA